MTEARKPRVPAWLKVMIIIAVLGPLAYLCGAGTSLIGPGV